MDHLRAEGPLWTAEQEDPPGVRISEKPPLVSSPSTHPLWDQLKCPTSQRFWSPAAADLPAWTCPCHPSVGRTATSVHTFAFSVPQNVDSCEEPWGAGNRASDSLWIQPRLHL